jgi:hypothetical protein
MTMTDTIRNMLAEWDAATPEQRAAALALAAKMAARAHARVIAAADVDRLRAAVDTAV